MRSRVRWRLEAGNSYRREEGTLMMFGTLANWNELIRGANRWVRGCHGGFDGICHTCKRVFTRSIRRERGGGGKEGML